MAIIHDLIEVPGIAANTTYSGADGDFLGVVEGMTGADLDDGEFDEGDQVIIDGVTYTIDLIQEPATGGTITLSDGSELLFGPGSESNLDVVFLTLTSGGVTRHFILPNDSFGDMTVSSITTGSIQDVAGSDAAVIGTTDNEVGVICFAQGTMIEMAGGARMPIEDLRAGDLVRTRDRGLQPVRWIGRRSLEARELDRAPRLRPVRIRRGALGADRPCVDLRVSPQHRILVRSPIARRMFDAEEVLLPAKLLVGLDGISVDAARDGVTYFHLLFDRHEVVFANGAEAESLYTGPEALDTIADAARDELAAIFPGLFGSDHEARPVLPFADGRRGRRLIERHVRNGKPLYCAPTMSTTELGR